MASLKELKGRINSVKSTQKITKAKQMVAAAKLRRAQAAAEAARPYAERLSGVMASLAGKVSGDSAPKLLAGTGSDKRHLLVVVNTDKGLCGGLNVNLFKAVVKDAVAWKQQGAELDARSLCTIENDKIAPFKIRIGKYGPFAEYEEEGSEKPKVLNLPEEWFSIPPIMVPYSPSTRCFVPPKIDPEGPSTME